MEKIIKSKQIDASELKKILRADNLSHKATQALLEVCIKGKFSSGDTIWQMGGPGNFFAIIVKGIVEITRYTSNEEEMAMGIFGPSDVIGISAVIKKTTYPGTAKVLSHECEILKFYIRPVIQKPDDANAEIIDWIRELLLNHEQVLRDKIDIVNAPSVDYRIFELLKHLIRRFAQHESEIKHTIPIGLTRCLVSKLIDVRVETVIRAINRWQKLGLITWTKDKIIIENLSLLEKNLTKGKNKK